MTISYSDNICRLLFRWKGSLWRTVWKELLIYLLLFYLVKVFYACGIDYLSENLDDRQRYRGIFEAMCRMFKGYTALIPLTFLLGFYVSEVISRWWQQFEVLPWPEDMLSWLCIAIPCNDEKSRQRRHTVARYIILSTVLVWRDISKSVRLRFPRVSSLVDAELISKTEYEALEAVHEDCEALRWMEPIRWSQQLLLKEFTETNFPTGYLNRFLAELQGFRSSLRKLYCYDWVCIPLVYTQVTAIATYFFFVFSLFGHQTLDPEVTEAKQVDLHVPVFAIFQFMFLVGQDLVRPFGADDDDIELNYLLDRHLQTAIGIVERMQVLEFEPEEDQLWKNKDKGLRRLPHSSHSKDLVERPPRLNTVIKEDLKEGKARCFSKSQHIK
ncbi:unnamed protein product [Nippostrongylus brasiliensis]|uniref:Bestrophin homolog n=1 Tax=Nippostrongylus brasiliensis TaxID=27835 RepID=A0A0N4Y4I4_NIPBR|nr:unnamed protein product [Nippostrongylus brasiliensis]